MGDDSWKHDITQNEDLIAVLRACTYKNSCRPLCMDIIDTESGIIVRFFRTGRTELAYPDNCDEEDFQEAVSRIKEKFLELR